MYLCVYMYAYLYCACILSVRLYVLMYYVVACVFVYELTLIMHYHAMDVTYDVFIYTTVVGI